MTPTDVSSVTPVGGPDYPKQPVFYVQQPMPVMHQIPSVYRGGCARCGVSRDGQSIERVASKIQGKIFITSLIINKS